MLALRRASLPLRSHGFSIRASSASCAHPELTNSFYTQSQDGCFNAPMSTSLGKFYSREHDTANLFMTRRGLSSQVDANLLSQDHTALLGSQGNVNEALIEEQNAYARQLIKKFVNLRMRGGKRASVRTMLYQTLHRVAQTESDVMKLMSEAVENVKPVCQVEKVGVAGTVYDVPGLVSKHRQQSLAVRWILDAASKRRVNHKVTLEKCLYSELLDAYRKRGVARKKRENVHKVASNNRSFAHFRWR